MASRSYSETITHVARAYAQKLQAEHRKPESDRELLNLTNEEIRLHNAILPKGAPKWKELQKLLPVQVAITLMGSEHICHVSPDDIQDRPDLKLLGVYQEEGRNAGIYDTTDKTLRKLVIALDPLIGEKEYKDVLFHLHNLAPDVSVETDRDLICVNNGIFNYRKKTFSPHSPGHVFIQKIHVNWNPDANEPPILLLPNGKPWDVERWMASISISDDVRLLLWQILSAVVRSNVRWNKSIWLYSETGNNGKGTFCELARNLCGPGAWTSIPLSNFSGEFQLEPLLRVNAIITDENDVGLYIDRAANLKAVITGDVFTVNRKYKDPIAWRFHGLMIQCLNEYPRVKDRSESFYRRQLFVPMDKCFTGHAQACIKNEFLKDPDVLEYVLYRILMEEPFYEFSEPDICKAVLAEYKEANDPIRQFWADMAPKLAWDLVPYQFLYDLYCAWYPRNVPGSGSVGRKRFVSDLTSIVNADPASPFKANKTRQIRPTNRMSVPEPLIMEYNLKAWQAPTFGAAPDLRSCVPDPSRLSSAYRGLLRKEPEAPL